MSRVNAKHHLLYLIGPSGVIQTLNFKSSRVKLKTLKFGHKSIEYWYWVILPHDCFICQPHVYLYSDITIFFKCNDHGRMAFYSLDHIKRRASYNFDGTSSSSAFGNRLNGCWIGLMSEFIINFTFTFEKALYFKYAWFRVRDVKHIVWVLCLFREVIALRKESLNTFDEFGRTSNTVALYEEGPIIS